MKSRRDVKSQEKVSRKMQWSDRLHELEASPDRMFPTISRGERVIRWILLTGFLLVLALEGWLVLQLLRML